MAEDHGDKSLEPTAHRRQQARAQGHVARSGDLNSAGLLLGGLLILIFTGRALVEFLAGFLSSYLGGDPWLAMIRADGPLDSQFVMTQWNTLLPQLAQALLPVVALVAILAVGMNVLQVGILFLPHKVLPDFSRVDPSAGLARVFSPTGASRLAFGIFTILVISAVGLASVYGRRQDLLSLADRDVPQIALLAWELCLWTSLKMGGALAVLAVLDFGFQRWKHERDLKMTPQEMREETRALQGDPQLLARRRNVMRHMSRGRLSQAVPSADVVIVLAAELAIALRYDADSMRAPVVVAKGAGAVASQIQRLALEHGIPLVEKHPLARSLYRRVELNRPVGNELFAEVAEVLAYAYQTRNKPLPAALA